MDEGYFLSGGSPCFIKCLFCRSVGGGGVRGFIPPIRLVGFFLVYCTLAMVVAFRAG